MSTRPAMGSHCSATGPVQFTATRARALRKENIAARERDRSSPPVATTRTPTPATVRRTLQRADTAIIGDTVDFSSLSVHELNGTAVGPARILAGLEADNDDVYYHLWVAARHAVEENGGRRLDKRMIKAAMEQLVVEVGVAMYERSGGPHLTFVDPRNNDDAAAMVRSARRLVALFRARGLGQGEIVIGIPATEAGVAAARALEADHRIHTNLILVASLMHAAACAEARATTISIAVGPLLQCHERKRNAVYPDLAMHPGIEIVQVVLAYFKLHEIRTRIVGRDFRTLTEISALPGFDAVCLSKEQLDVSLWKPETRSPDLPARSPQASMRARQAQHPTTFLESELGFMELMSAEARGMLAAAMFPALGKMELQMNAIEKLVTEEVAWQLALKALDLDKLYELRGPAPPSSPAGKTRRDPDRICESNRVGATRRAPGSERKRMPLAEASGRQNEGGLIEGVEYF